MADVAIRVRGLRKSYGPVEAVRALDLTVQHGEVFSLLGPNGAGKTTVIEILEGHRSRNAGEVDVLGHDPESSGPAFRRRIGIVLQDRGVEPYLTVAETIEQFRGYYPEPRPLDEVIEVVGLQHKRGERVKKLSGGQQRRLDVAIGLAGDPDLLFLDEPTTGFDPSARHNAWDMVRNLKSLGKTVLLTTHYMDEAQNLSDRVAILVRGEIVAEGSPEILTNRDRTTRVRFRLPENAPSLPAELGAAKPSEGGSIELRTEDPVSTLHKLTSWSLANSVELANLSVTRASLEDVYLELTASDTRTGS
jgi:ABC-2 type transport system ATP-binding protein